MQTTNAQALQNVCVCVCVIDGWAPVCVCVLAQLWHAGNYAKRPHLRQDDEYTSEQRRIAMLHYIEQASKSAGQPSRLDNLDLSHAKILLLNRETGRK